MSDPEAERPEVLRPSAPMIGGLVAIGVVQAGAVAGTVLLLRRIIDRVAAGDAPTSLTGSALVLCAVGLVLAAARGVEYVAAERMGYRLVAEARVVLHRHLLGLPARSVTRSSQGAVLLRLTGDLSTYRTWLSRGLARGIVAATVLVIGLGVLFVIHPVIGLFAVLLTGIGSGLSVLIGDQVRRRTRSVRWRRSLLASNVAEQIGALAVIQAFGRMGGESSRLGRQNEDLLRAQRRAADARGLLRLVSSATSGLALGVVVLVGLTLVGNGSLTVGGLVGAVLGIRLLTGPVRTLGRSHEYWQAARVSRRKLADFLARAPRGGLGPEYAPLRVRRARLDFEDVTVTKALDGVTFTAEPGELVAVTGANGSGKSTLLASVLRMVELDRGRVLIDGQPIDHHNARSLARNIGAVGPDLPLLRGSIRRNLTYRYREATPEMLEAVIDDCRLDEVFDNIGGGLDAWVVEGGRNLPVGHRQRIALARAIIGSPRLLVLDEPSANLDGPTREIVRRVLARYSGTVLLATHDPIEAQLADRVITLDDGRLASNLTGDEHRDQAVRRRLADAGRPLWS